MKFSETPFFRLLKLRFDRDPLFKGTVGYKVEIDKRVYFVVVDDVKRLGIYNIPNDTEMYVLNPGSGVDVHENDNIFGLPQ